MSNHVAGAHGHVCLAAFAHILPGRQVWIFEDYTAAEAATGKGSCRADDQDALIHDIWTIALKCDTSLWLDRVPGDENVADLSSRGEYELLQELGGVWMSFLIPEFTALA